MVIFHSYVKLPEAILGEWFDNGQISSANKLWKCDEMMKCVFLWIGSCTVAMNQIAANRILLIRRPLHVFSLRADSEFHGLYLPVNSQ